MFTYISTGFSGLYVSRYDKLTGRKVYEYDTKFKPSIYIKNPNEKNAKLKSFPKMIPVSIMKAKNIKEYYEILKSYPQDMICANNGGNSLIFQKIREDGLNKDLDFRKLKIGFMDIETFSQRGFPKPNKAEHPIISKAVLIRGGNYNLWYLSKSFVFDRYEWFRFQYEDIIDLGKGNYEYYMKKYDDVVVDKIKELNDLYSKNNELKEVYMQILKLNKFHKTLDRAKNMEIFKFNTEEEMLCHYTRWIAKNELDVLCGWNSEKFDNPYFSNRMKRLGLEENYKDMSPFKVVKPVEIECLGEEPIISSEIVGLTQFDYMQMDMVYHTNKRDSYTLDSVAEEIAGIHKVEFSGSHADFWLRDKQKFLTYNLRDVECLEAIDEKLGYINLAFETAHYTGSSLKSYDAATAKWTGRSFNYFLDKGFIIPSSNSMEKSGSIEGAYVKEPIYGLIKYIMSKDATSLYPSLIRWANMSHETIIDEEKTKMNIIEKILDGSFDFSPWKDKQKLLTPFGTVFNCKEQGMIPTMIKELFMERKADKKEYEKYKELAKNEKDVVKKEEYTNLSIIFYNKQMAKKILLNSFYGALAVSSFCLHHKDMAESITTMGQISNRYIFNSLNEYINKLLKTTNIDYIVGGDTDSGYINMSGFVDKIPKEKRESMTEDEIITYLDNIDKQFLDKHINETCKKLFDYMGGFENTLHFDREVIGKGAFWKAKKRYAIRVYDMEGYRYPKPVTKITGIQIVRSDTPREMKPFMRKFVDLLLEEKDIYSFYSEVKEKFKSIGITKIATPITIKGLSDYFIKETDSIAAYGKGTPNHVKASIHFNQLLTKLKLLDKYEMISNGDKVFTINLNDNKYGIEVIAFKNVLPKEFQLDEYINYDKQFEKVIGKFFNDMSEFVGRKSELSDDEMFDDLF